MIDYPNFFKVLAFFSLGLVFSYKNIPKGRFWERSKKSFVRSPLLNLAAIAFALVVLAAAAFPALRPDWVQKLFYAFGAILVAAGIIFLIISRRRASKEDAEFLRREITNPKIERASESFGQQPSTRKK